MGLVTTNLLLLLVINSHPIMTHLKLSNSPRYKQESLQPTPDMGVAPRPLNVVDIMVGNGPAENFHFIFCVYYSVMFLLIIITTSDTS